MLHGGELHTGTRSGGGFFVSARLPIAQPAGCGGDGHAGGAPVAREQLGRSFDPALAAILLVVAETELMIVRHGSPPVRDVLMLAALTIPLAWRRRVPLAVAAVAVGVMAVSSLFAQPLIGLVQTPEVVGFIAPYTVAAYCSPVRARAGLAICLAGLEPAVLLAAGGVGASEMAIGACVASWGAGRAVLAHRQRADDLTRTSRVIASEREDRERLAVVDERTRIARELQAAVAHTLSTMVVQSEAAERLLDTDRAQADAAMAMIERTGRQALDEMRRILGVLRDPEQEVDLVPQPAVGQLYELIEAARATGRRVELHIEGAPRPLSASVDLAVYRIVQEALASTSAAAGLGAVGDQDANGWSPPTTHYSRRRSHDG